MSFLTLENLSFSIGEWELAVSLTLGQGECLAVIGPSGAGKSTLLSLISGFDQPTRGRIIVDGQAIDHLRPASRPVTMMFQENNLFNHLTLYENIALGCDPGLKLNQNDRLQIESALAATELSNLANRLPGDVSGGERQRAALARCLCQKRPLLLLDEPFANLDPRLRHQMHELVNTLRQAHGLTVIVVSHMPSEIAQIADQVLFLHNGRVLESGRSERVLANPCSPELTEYLNFTRTD